MREPTDALAATTDVGSMRAPAATGASTEGPASSHDATTLASAPSRASSPPSESGAPFVIGDIIAEKYKIERVLGQGGVGVVVAALHIRMNHRVAIKFLLPGATHEAIERFSREAQSAMKLKSEHAAKVLDVGELPNGAPYMVLEFLDGSDLADHLTFHGPLPIEEGVEYLLQACEAMAEAHAAGIIHRDLKPANLFLTQTGGRKMIKVLDFGISKDVADPAGGRSGMSLTRTSSVFGSPLYMPPEQMRSARAVDVRSDIWSLGVILYELLTGRPPFDAELYPDLVMKISIEPPPAPSSLRKEIPSKLEAAILKCLEKKPANRFQDIGKLAAALAPFVRAQARGSLDRIQKTLESAPMSAYVHEEPPPRPRGMGASDGSTHAKSDGAGAGEAGARRSNALLWKVVGATVAASAALVIGVAALLGVFKEPERAAIGAPITPATDATASALSTGASTEQAPPPVGVTPAGEPKNTAGKPQGALSPSSGASTAAAHAPSAAPSVGAAQPPTPSAPPPPSASPTAPPSAQAAAPTQAAPPQTTPPPPPTAPKKNPLDMEIK